MSLKRYLTSLIVVLLALGGLLVAASPAVTAGSEGVMVVEVVARSGDLLSNVRVASYQGARRIGIGSETARGVYELPIPDTGEFDVVCSSPGWQPAWVTKLFGGEGQRMRKTLLREGETDEVARIAGEAAERFIGTLPLEEQHFLLEDIRFRP